mmetsp:Transcript_147620/g.456624  ORF Transcript_147620/g.456624 Transcript_147620/m.456624 type:complete len:273 (-) Transcript_147620:114-932(-)
MEGGFARRKKGIQLPVRLRCDFARRDVAHPPANAPQRADGVPPVDHHRAVAEEDWISVEAHHRGVGRVRVGGEKLEGTARQVLARAGREDEAPEIGVAGSLSVLDHPRHALQLVPGPRRVAERPLWAAEALTLRCAAGAEAVLLHEVLPVVKDPHIHRSREAYDTAVDGVGLQELREEAGEPLLRTRTLWHINGIFGNIYDVHHEQVHTLPCFEQLVFHIHLDRVDVIGCGPDGIQPLGGDAGVGAFGAVQITKVPQKPVIGISSPERYEQT